MSQLLSLLVLLPLVAGLLCFVVDDREAKPLSLVATLATFALSLVLWANYDPQGPAFQFAEKVSWIPEYGIYYAVGIDGISLLLILLTTFLGPVVVLSATPAVEKKLHVYLGWMLVLEGAMLGTFAAMDMFLFYVFWELMLIPMYFLIGVWGGKDRIYATIKFFIYTMVGSLLMLVAIIWLYRLHMDVYGEYSAIVTDYYGIDIARQAQMWLFAAFALAFAIKVPMWPLHTWLPDAHVQAPTGGSVILAGVLLKMGAYGFVRFAMPIFPDAAVAFTPFMIGLSVIGIIYGALVAMVQDDIKKLVAYSSVSHLGFVMLGLFAFNSLGWSGGIYQMLNHGLSTGALFLLVGVLYERRHTREISEYGGIASVMPAYAFVLMLVTFSSIGLPGLNGFVGEFLVLLGSFQRSPWMTMAAASGVVLGAVYMLWMVERVLYGPQNNPKNNDLLDLTRREWTYLVPILVMIVVMGVFPGPFLEVLQPSVDRILGLMQSSMEPMSAVTLFGGEVP